MSIDRHGWIARHSLEALCHEIKYRRDLLARHVELLHHFLDGQIFEVLDNGRNGQAGFAKYPCTAHFSRNAFHGRALGPVESRHSSYPPSIEPSSRFGAAPRARL